MSNLVIPERRGSDQSIATPDSPRLTTPLLGAADSKTSTLAREKFAFIQNRAHYDQWEGLINVAADTAGLPASLEGTLYKFDVTSEKVPDVCGARRYFSVLTGVLGMVKGSQMYEEAKKANYVWGQTEGVIRFTKGMMESIVGLMAGTLSMLTTFASGLDLSAMSIAGEVSDALFCLSMLCVTVNSLHNARMTGDLKRQLQNAANIEDKKKILYEIANDHVNGGELKLKKFTGLEVDQIEGLDETKIEALITKLKWDEFNKALIGTLALLTAILVVAGDIATAGSVSQGVSIAKLAVSSIFTIYDIYQLKDGLTTKKERTDIDKFIQIALTVVAIGISTAVLVAGNIATGGALSIALHVLTIAVPLIAMAIANRNEIAAVLRTVGHGVSTGASFVGHQTAQVARQMHHGMSEAGRHVINSLVAYATYFDPTRYVARAIPRDVIAL